MKMRDILAALVVAVLPAGASMASEPVLSLTLTDIKEVDSGCQGRFQLTNGLGHRVEHFKMVLAVFDRDGVLVDRLGVLVMPIRRDRPARAAVVLAPRPCAELGRVVVTDIPRCRVRGDTDDACRTFLHLDSHTRLPLGE